MTVTVEIDDRQRELLVQGLRFVRSSVLLEPREPSAEVRAERDRRVRELDELLAQLSGTPVNASART